MFSSEEPATEFSKVTPAAAETAAVVQHSFRRFPNHCNRTYCEVFLNSVSDIFFISGCHQEAFLWFFMAVALVAD